VTQTTADLVTIGVAAEARRIPTQRLGGKIAG
jgi:hypothetical protein